MLSQYKLQELIESHMAMGYSEEELAMEIERAEFESEGFKLYNIEDLRNNPDPPDPSPIAMAA